MAWKWNPFTKKLDYYEPSGLEADTIQFLDLWNPIVRDPAPPNFSINNAMAQNAVTNAYLNKKHNNVITFNVASNCSRILIAQVVASAGTVKLGIDGALQGIQWVAITNSYGMTLDMNGHDNSMVVPPLAGYGSIKVDNTSANDSLCTLTGSGSLAPTMRIRRTGTGQNNIVQAGSSLTLTWSITPVHDANFWTYTIWATNTLVDNNTILNSAINLIFSGSSPNLTLSTIDRSGIIQLLNWATAIIRNNTANCILASAFGDTPSGTPSTASITFNGANAANYTTISGDNTWVGSTTLGQNAYVKLWHANALGTAAGLAFSIWPWRMDNISGSPMTLSKTVSFLQTGTLTYDGSNTLSLGGGTISAAITIAVTASSIGFTGSFTGTFAFTKTWNGELYISSTAWWVNVNGGKYSGLSMGALVLANTAWVIFKPLWACTCLTAVLWGTNARVEFEWNAGMNRFFYLTASSNVNLSQVGLNFTGSPANGVYDIIISGGVMSGTLPTIASNTTGKTLVLSQVGNTLKVTVS
jgi:hypothetical protein